MLAQFLPRKEAAYGMKKANTFNVFACSMSVLCDLEHHSCNPLNWPRCPVCACKSFEQVGDTGIERAVELAQLEHLASN